MQQVYSPFDPNKKARIVKTISTAELIKSYKNLYEIQVDRCFGEVKEILLCECPLTGLHFYTPASCAGDPLFYEHMSEKPWYYHPERWEHRSIAHLIKPGSSILEIGAGDGAFSSLLHSIPGVTYHGLEFNPEAIKNAEKKSIRLFRQSIVEHSKTTSNHYDIVCSFQVMEHVPDIASTIEHSLAVLKKGGRLIVAVPNNSVSFINVLSNIHPSKYLNMPPHHMNLFDERSLPALSVCFPMKVEQTILEPLQDMHMDVYIYNRLGKLLFRNARLTNLIWKTGLAQLWRPFVKRRQTKIKGHTLIVIFEKT